MRWSGFKMFGAALIGAFVIGGAAEAATINFDQGKPKKGEIYVDGGFAFDPVRIVNGGCLEKGCAALNKNESMTMTLVEGGIFDLRSISFSLLGEGKKKSDAGGGALVLTTNTGVTLSFTTADYSHNSFHTFALNADQFRGVRSVAFTSTGGGNIRLDSFAAAISTSSSVSAVPLPASLWLMLGALGGLGLARSRRAA